MVVGALAALLDAVPAAAPQAAYADELEGGAFALEEPLSDALEEGIELLSHQADKLVSATDAIRRAGGGHRAAGSRRELRQLVRGQTA